VNSIEGRWLRIKRFDTHDLDGLHAAERNADLKWNENRNDPAKRGDGWEINGIRYMDSLDRRLGPYFDSGKEESEKAREIAMFQACPVVRRCFAKMDQTELSDQAYIAQADFEIHGKAYTPNFGRGSSDNKARLAALYAKAEPRKTTYQDD